MVVASRGEYHTPMSARDVFQSEKLNSAIFSDMFRSEGRPNVK